MLKIITDVSAELILVAEAADFLRVDSNGDSPPTYPNQTTIESLITAARQWTEEYLYRRIGVQTLELTLDGFPTVNQRGITLPSPLINTDPITSFKYLDTEGTEQTMDLDTDYVLAIDSEPAEIRPKDGGSWPVAQNTTDSVRIRFQCGYDNSGVSPIVAPTLPKTIRTAVLMMMADMYENREAQVERPLTANPTVERLLSQYRLEMGL